MYLSLILNYKYKKPFQLTMEIFINLAKKRELWQHSQDFIL